ncbi:hypothetical protein C0Z22_11280 [Halobacteriovorax sp. DA5]|nr:hypothetical protein C0Z22_11280 [Halobacteriovorax sp. DA5]
MDFVNTKLLIISIIVVAIFIFFLTLLRKKFFKIVKQVWNFDSRFISKLSMFLYALAFLGFALSLGDLRGPEELVESNIPNQRTLILIDNSQSMLVEDIRPNRIAKAAIIAKHLVKNAYGHQIALSVFSDIQRKIVPFTDDVDILESRLGSMLSATPEGGSNVSLALKEAFQFFKTSEGFSKGNILLITDGEEHGSVDVEIPDEISLAIIGVGTEEGGKIPMRGKRGNFFGYKKFNGVEIISKMNKQFFEDLVGKSKYAKVWFVESYSLPTQEILAFFKDVHLNSFTKGTLRSRPVLGYWLIVSSILLYVFSVLLGRFRTFKPAVLVLLMCLFILPEVNTFAQDDEETPVDPLQQELVDKMRAGNISKEEKLKLAELFLRQKEGQKQAAEIYNETLKNYEDEAPADLFNYATALLKDNQFVDSINLYKYILEKNSNNKELEQVIKEQIKFALQKQKQDKQKKKEEEKKKQQEKKDKENKDNQENNENKDNNDDQQKKEGQQDDKDQKDKGQQGKDSKNNKDNKKSDSSDKNKDKQQSEGDQNKNEKKKQKTQQQQWKELEDQAKKKKRMRKANGVFKQIMNDDSQLQKKLFDSTSDGNNRKDW